MRKSILAVSAFALAVSAHGAMIPPFSITGTGSYNHSETLLIDGVAPSEGTQWQSGTNVWWTSSSPSSFKIDYGAISTISDLLISVDNNDGYELKYSIDGISWATLITVSASYGEIGNGMDTMSSDSTHGEYISEIDFTSVSARYLSIEAFAGDGLYSIAEVQAHGRVFGIPIPDSGSSALLVLSGLGSLIAFRRRFAR